MRNDCKGKGQPQLSVYPKRLLLDGVYIEDLTGEHFRGHHILPRERSGGLLWLQPMPAPSSAVLERARELLQGCRAGRTDVCAELQVHTQQRARGTLLRVPRQAREEGTGKGEPHGRGAVVVGITAPWGKGAGQGSVGASCPDFLFNFASPPGPRFMLVKWGGWCPMWPAFSWHIHSMGQSVLPHPPGQKPCPALI